MNKYLPPAVLAIGATAAQAQTPPDTSPAALVDALNGTFGSHGMRASHAKGFCATGEFVPAEGAADIVLASRQFAQLFAQLDTLLAREDPPA